MEFVNAKCVAFQRQNLTQTKTSRMFLNIAAAATVFLNLILEQSLTGGLKNHVFCRGGSHFKHFHPFPDVRGETVEAAQFGGFNADV